MPSGPVHRQALDEPQRMIPLNSTVSCRLLLLLAVVGTQVAAASTTPAPSVEFHVSPNGNDDADGGPRSPFATIRRAQLEAHEHLGREAVTVWLGAGVHYLEKTLRLTHEDSGTEKFPVTYRGKDDAVISGGRFLALEWESAENGVFRARTPADLEFDQLFVDGKRQHMARYPNFDPDVRVFNGHAADAFSKERAASWKDPAGGYIHAMHRAHWGGYHYRITGKDATGQVTFEGGWQNNRQMGMHREHRFVENIFEELDAPGEWFHDSDTNTLHYMPGADVDLASARVEVVRLRHLVEFDGSEERPVRYVTLQGLTFRHAARTFMLNREPLLRSDWTTYRGGAVFARGAEQCRVVQCSFDQVGGNAIFFSDYNRNIEVIGCHIRDAGSNGIAFVGNPEAVRSPLFQYEQRQSLADIDTTPGPKSNGYPAHALVEDCLVVRTGRVEKQTAGIQVSMASHVRVRQCSIYEVPRAGINISEGTFGGHIIEFCDVFDTVLETGDHGSFNSWGRDRFWGLRDTPAARLPELAKLDMVAPNVIRNSRWRCDHGWDIDLDDGSSNYRVHDNLLLKGGLKFREGFHRVAENNIMVGNSFHPHVWYPNSGDIVRRNIVFTEYRPIRVPKPWGAEIDWNLLHRPGHREPAPAARLAEQSARDVNSIVADALFVDPESGDFRVKDGSPALALGFRNFPMDRFGVQLPALKKLARKPEIPGPGSPVQGRRSVLIKAEHRWLGARVRDLSGADFSSLGVSKEEGGVHLSRVPETTPAASFGLRTNDLVQKVNDDRVQTIADLHRVQNALSGKPMRVTIVRDQVPLELDIASYSYYVSTTSAEDALRDHFPTRGQTIDWVEISTRPETVNEPLAKMGDGVLAKNYGPVFKNGVSAGKYRVDLGMKRRVTSVTTISYNESGKRGAQRYLLFGSTSPQDPGWGFTKDSGYRFVGEVDTRGSEVEMFHATRLVSSTGGLGRFRWLLWVVYPVTEIGENTAFQEFIIDSDEKQEG